MYFYSFTIMLLIFRLGFMFDEKFILEVTEKTEVGLTD